MTFVKDRYIGRYSHYDGGVIEPSAKAGVEGLPDGQVQPITDWVGIHLGIREGGSLVPPVDVGVRNSTQERLIMYVGFATGSSPAEGTKVVNQAEYDALGADLKYLDDAFAILPDNIAWPVEIHLRDGVQHPNPDNLYYTPALDGEQLIMVPQRLRSVDSRIDYSNTSYYYPSIYIIGDNKTVLDAEQSGTIAADNITRDSGTWTANEHQGKLVLITSGAGAGKIAPIYKNDTTTLYIPNLEDSGSCNFEIYEPASSLEYNVPGNAFTGLGYDNVNAMIAVDIFNVTVGSTSTPAASTSGAHNYYFHDSIFHTQRLQFDGVLNVGRFYFYNSCMLIDDAASAGLRFGYCETDFRESAVLGVGAFNHPLLTLHSGIEFWSADSVFYLTTDHDEALLYVDSLASLELSGGKFIGPGTGNATGYLILGHVSGDIGIIQDCGAGVNVSGGILTVGYVSSNSSGNTDGIVVSDGGQLVVGSPGNLGGSSSEITIDGEAFLYSDLSSGDSLTGQSGSQIVSR